MVVLMVVLVMVMVAVVVVGFLSFCVWAVIAVLMNNFLRKGLSGCHWLPLYYQLMTDDCTVDRGNQDSHSTVKSTAH